MGKSWWIVIIQLHDCSTASYAVEGFNRVNAKFNAEGNIDFRDYLKNNHEAVRDIAVLKAKQSYKCAGFIEK